ncbi:MAG: hypothetical protein IKM24_10675 [Clostridia bacterium]|nr:hypothetical protein [Clostridia bacterium]MBR6781464.1 hypothetical protein [Clostridia bacterium]
MLNAMFSIPSDWAGITEVDIVNLFIALFDTIISVFANSDTTAVVFALTGA